MWGHWVWYHHSLLDHQVDLSYGLALVVDRTISVLLPVGWVVSPKPSSPPSVGLVCICNTVRFAPHTPVTSLILFSIINVTHVKFLIILVQMDHWLLAMSLTELLGYFSEDSVCLNTVLHLKVVWYIIFDFLWLLEWSQKTSWKSSSCVERCAASSHEAIWKRYINLCHSLLSSVEWDGLKGQHGRHFVWLWNGKIWCFLMVKSSNQVFIIFL